MTTINQKMGLRPAGKRSMMKLPRDSAQRNQLTAARCPSCGQTGARLSKVVPGAYVCSWCNWRTWQPEVR